MSNLDLTLADALDRSVRGLTGEGFRVVGAYWQPGTEMLYNNKMRHVFTNRRST